VRREMLHGYVGSKALNAGVEWCISPMSDRPGKTGFLFFFNLMTILWVPDWVAGFVGFYTPK